MHMNLSKTSGFLISAIASFFILNRLPFDSKLVELIRIERSTPIEKGWTGKTLSQCSKFTSQNSTREEDLWAERLVVAANTSGAPCQVSVTSVRTQQMGLRTFTKGDARISNSSGTVIANRAFSLQTPTPLVLFPFALFLLGLIFRVVSFGPMLTFFLFALAMEGGNLILLFSTLFQATVSLWSNDKYLWGLTLILAWVALFSTREEPPVDSPRRLPFKLPTIWSQCLGVLIGMWSPGVFSCFMSLFRLPARGISKLSPLFNQQILVATLSLYLFNIDRTRGGAWLESSLLLPRYFSFAVLVLLLLQPRPLFFSAQETQSWFFRFLRPAFFVIPLELLLEFWPAWRSFSLVARIGLLLVLSEAMWPKGLRTTAAAKVFLSGLLPLFLCFLAGELTLRSGVPELVTVISHPRFHPSFFPLFVFLSGFLLAFVTGNPATAYFTLVLDLWNHQVPRGALLDGILAGSLLSPFSILNWVPLKQLGIRPIAWYLGRFRQLGPALAIGGFIYTIGGIQSVAILQPVTFIFLILVAVAFALKERGWQWTKSTT